MPTRAKKKLHDLCMALICFIIVFAAAGAAKSFALGETSRSDYRVAPGVTESTVYVTADGGQNVRTHILRISKDSGIKIKASYGGYYGDMNTADDRSEKAEYWDESDWTFESVRDQARGYSESADTGYDVVAAANGDFFDTESGEPEGGLVIEGNIIRKTGKRPFFAVLKNGKTVIRRAGGRIGDTEEVVSGNAMLLWKDKIVVRFGQDNDPRTAIGICSDGTIILLSVDGREPASPGVTMYELASIMKAQGCRYALNLDGGGSVSFLTKRADDKDLVFRTNHSDGAERNVGSALLIVRKGSDYAVSTDSPGDPVYAAGMKSKETRLWRDRTDTWRYKVKKKGQTGFFVINGKPYLFSKGSGVTTTVKIGKTTYSFEKGRLESTSDDEAGQVVIGYCGAAGNSGKNLIYAYHYGDQLLNVGLNPFFDTRDGRMKNWNRATVLEMPWYSVRADIKKVYVEDDIVNLGGYFLYSKVGRMTGGAPAPECNLESIRLPSSLRKIGAYSLYNKPHLAKLTIPSKVKSIGRYALAYSGKGLLSFRSKTPPAFRKAAMKKTGFKTVHVKKSKAWKTFVRQEKFRKYGYKKTVKYVK